MLNEETSVNTAENKNSLEKTKKETDKIDKDNKNSKKRGSSLLRGVLIVLILILGVWLIGGMPRISKIMPFGQKSPNPAKELNLGNEPGTQPLQVPQSAQAEEDAVTQVVDKSSPAVVSIIITKDIPKIQNFNFDPFGDGSGSGSSLFDQFFGQQQPGGTPNQAVPGVGGTVKQEIGG
ncbi:MAG: hypothetical protein V1690_00950, partial [Candidatus Moraniibacteriota bacterium]